MRASRFAIALPLFCVVVLCASTASAQFFGTREKPFANFQRSPAVSPYLNLFRNDGAISNYYTLVQPQLEQQRINQRQNRTNQTQQRFAAQQQAQLQAISVRARVREGLRPTGGASLPVSSRFMNFGTFFGGGRQ